MECLGGDQCRSNPLASQLSNFGWPAYEGTGKQGTYSNQNLPLIQDFYADVQADPSLHTQPFFAYSHSSQVDAGTAEPTGSSAISGMAFYHGANYPAAFDGALFFADYNRGRVWAMFRGLDGEPDPSTVTTIIRFCSGSGWPLRRTRRRHLLRGAESQFGKRGNSPPDRVFREQLCRPRPLRWPTFCKVPRRLP